MKVAGDSAELLAEMRTRMQTAQRYLLSGQSELLITELDLILAAEDRVTAEPGECLVCFDSLEHFLHYAVLFREGRLTLPAGAKQMVWHPVPLAAAHTLIGTLMLNEGHVEEAQRCFMKALSYCPNYCFALHELSYLFQEKLAEPGKALRYARQAFEYSFNAHARAHELRAAGAACIDLAAHDLARCFYLEAAEFDPDAPLVQSQLQFISGSSVTGLDVPVPDKDGRRKALGLLGFRL